MLPNIPSLCCCDDDPMEGGAIVCYNNFCGWTDFRDDRAGPVTTLPPRKWRTVRLANVVFDPQGNITTATLTIRRWQRYDSNRSPTNSEETFTGQQAISRLTEAEADYFEWPKPAPLGLGRSGGYLSEQADLVRYGTSRYDNRFGEPTYGDLLSTEIQTGTLEDEWTYHDAAADVIEGLAGIAWPRSAPPQFEDTPEGRLVRHDNYFGFVKYLRLAPDGVPNEWNEGFGSLRAGEQFVTQVPLYPDHPADKKWSVQPVDADHPNSSPVVSGRGGWLRCYGGQFGAVANPPINRVQDYSARFVRSRFEAVASRDVTNRSQMIRSLQRVFGNIISSAMTFEQRSCERTQVSPVLPDFWEARPTLSAGVFEAGLFEHEIEALYTQIYYPVERAYWVVSNTTGSTYLPEVPPGQTTC